MTFDINFIITTALFTSNRVFQVNFFQLLLFKLEDNCFIVVLVSAIQRKSVITIYIDIGIPNLYLYISSPS